MIRQLRVLALVPARAGSKGLPGKNVRHLAGRPLIAWSIGAGLGAASIDAVVASTDSEEIAAVARAAGAEVPFLRPAELATDTAASIDVVLHALDALSAAGRTFDVVVLLEPTSPLRESGDIERGLARMLDAGASAVVSVCRAEAVHPAFMYRQAGNGRLRPYLERQPTGLRRQDIEPLYYLEGTLYASTVEALRRRRSFYHEDTVAYEVPKSKALEIDDQEDFEMAEALLLHRGNGWTTRTA